MRAGGTSGVEPGTYCNPAETTLPLSSIVPFCRSFPAVRHKMKRSDSTSGVPSPGWRAEWDSNPLPPGCAAGAHPHVLPARMNGGRTDRPLIQLSSAPLIEKQTKQMVIPAKFLAGNLLSVGCSAVPLASVIAGLSTRPSAVTPAAVTAAISRERPFCRRSGYVKVLNSVCSPEAGLAIGMPRIMPRGSEASDGRLIRFRFHHFPETFRVFIRPGFDNVGPGPFPLFGSQGLVLGIKIPGSGNHNGHSSHLLTDTGRSPHSRTAASRRC